MHLQSVNDRQRCQWIQATHMFIEDALNCYEHFGASYHTAVSLYQLVYFRLQRCQTDLDTWNETNV